MTRYDPKKHHRRSIRLKGYDYALTGAYYATIDIQGGRCLFGEVVEGEMKLSDAGSMIEAEWHSLPDRFPTVKTDAFVVMPNHIHGIIVLGAGSLVRASLVGSHSRAGDQHGTTIAGDQPGAAIAGDQHVATIKDAPTDNDDPTNVDSPTLGDVVGALKSLTTVGYTRGVKQYGWPRFAGRLWQRNYYEHVVRDRDEMNRIRLYIAHNPGRWAEDRTNPAWQEDGEVVRAPALTVG